MKIAAFSEKYKTWRMEFAAIQTKSAYRAGAARSAPRRLLKISGLVTLVKRVWLV
jgi:hypothetical protein